MRKFIKFLRAFFVAGSALLAVVCGLATNNVITLCFGALLLTFSFGKKLITSLGRTWLVCALVAGWWGVHYSMSGRLGTVWFVVLLLFVLMYLRGKTETCRWPVVLLVTAYFAWLACVSIDVCNCGGRCAYLERGIWGVCHSDRTELNIKSQYSYSLIKAAVSAESIDGLDHLSDYDRLWVITPTRPFSSREICQLVRWVDEGGELIIVTDHTDLFGHASVVQELISFFGLSVGKDCVILDAFEQVKFFMPMGWFYGLTANTVSGVCNPILFQLGYKERADYNGRSFFSDNAVTDEDEFGLYCAGALRRYGAGCVKVFGDSTMFADFALARPSSQFALRMLRDGLGVINFAFIVFLACLSILAVQVGKRIGRALGWLVFSLLLCYLVMLCIRTYEAMKRPLFSSGIPKTFQVGGNWDAVDFEGARFSVLFSTAYACSEDYPEWHSVPCHSGRLCCDRIIHGFESSQDIVVQRDLVSVLKSKISVGCDDFLESLLSSSSRDGFWFETGVGLLKERAYRCFWNEAMHKKRFGIKLGCRQVMNCSCRKDGESFFVEGVEMMEIVGEAEWVIVGDWIVGKRVGNEILIRERWQHPDRKFGNIVLSPREDRDGI